MKINDFWQFVSVRTCLCKEKSDMQLGLLKIGDKSLINPWIGLHEVPAKLNFEGETSELLLSSQANFVMCLG